MAGKEAFFADMIAYVRENRPDKRRIMTKKTEFCKKHGLNASPTDIEILMNAPKEELSFLKKYLYTKPVRTISGVAIVAVMTKPYGCPHGRCTMCPGGINSVFGSVPNSYTGHEPATMRAIRNDYDSYLQVFNRLEQYIVLGQEPDKVDLIVMGGTFPFTPKKYQEDFVYNCFKAMNDFSKLFYRKGQFDLDAFRSFFEMPGTIGGQERVMKVREKILALKSKGVRSLEAEHSANEKAVIRCIGLTIETKPDYGKLAHGNEMLRLGCTRVELGVQTSYDDVLTRIHRGHDLADTFESIMQLKDLGFKINYHIMLGLPGVTQEMDMHALHEYFDNPAFRPDMMKLYPCMVMPGTKLEQEWKDGKFIPIKTEDAAKLIAEAKKFIPEYVRIMRVQRDIPTKMSSAGLDKNNLRQIVEDILKKEGRSCRCIRCREIKGDIIKEPRIVLRSYEASGGMEHFISVETKDDRMVGFCRLRLPGQSLRKEITRDSAIIRELHVYGSAVAIGKEGEVQHRGFGKQLMKEAERIASEAGKKKMIVISGVGVRGYYRKLGYKKQGPYMVKKL